MDGRIAFCYLFSMPLIKEANLINNFNVLTILGMRPTSSEINIMQNEAVISGCITQPPDDDVEDFDIDGSQVRKKLKKPPQNL